MAEEVIEGSVAKETPVVETSSVDLSGRVLLLETRVLFLESNQVLKEPQIGIYGANRKPKH